jgi:hypothetical protein
MRFTNESLVPPEKLARIVSFLKRRFVKAASTVILLTAQADPQAPGAAFMTGDAYPSGGWARRFPQRHYVVIYVPTLTRPYPTKQQNPARLGECPLIALDNWEEELVTLLAHELEHVTQYEERGPEVGVAAIVEDADEQFEVLAERSAAAALGSWKYEQTKRRQTQEQRA